MVVLYNTGKVPRPVPPVHGGRRQHFGEIDIRTARLFIVAALAGASAQLIAAEVPTERGLIQDMVPAERSAARLELRTGYADKAFDASGDRRALFGEFNNVRLDSRVFPSLAALGPTATLGTTEFSSRLSGERWRLVYGYGVTPDLTLGGMLAWGIVRNTVKFSTSGANLAANPAFNPNAPVSPTNAPFVPLGTAGLSTPASTADVQRVLSAPAFGYQYRPIGTTTTGGLLDSLIGARWRVQASETSATILTPTLRLGWAKKDDPDDLLDFPPEDGTNDVILGVEHFRRLGTRWDLRGSTSFTWQTPDRITTRARGAGETLVPRSRTERLRRDPGDSIDAAVELGYRMGNVRLIGRLDWQRDFATTYHSDRGQDVSGLSGVAGARAAHGWLGLTWSGVEAWREGRLPLPLFLSIQYRTKLYAKNAVATNDLYLALTAVF